MLLSQCTVSIRFTIIDAHYGRVCHETNNSTIGGWCGKFYPFENIKKISREYLSFIFSLRYSEPILSLLIGQTNGNFISAHRIRLVVDGSNRRWKGLDLAMIK